MMFEYTDFFLLEGPMTPAEMALRHGLVPIKDKNGIPTRFYTTKAAPKWADGSSVAFAKSEGGKLIWIHPDQNDREDDQEKPDLAFKPTPGQHPNGAEPPQVKPSATPEEIAQRLDFSNIQQKMNKYAGPSEMGKKKTTVGSDGISELITKPWMPGFYFQNASSKFPIATDINGTFTRLDLPGREQQFEQAKELAARIRDAAEKNKKIKYAEKGVKPPDLAKTLEQLNRKVEELPGLQRDVGRAFSVEVGEFMVEPTYEKAMELVTTYDISTNPSNQRLTVGALGDNKDALTNRFSGQIMKAFQKALGHDYEAAIAVTGGLDTSMMPSVLFQHTRRPLFQKTTGDDGQVNAVSIDGMNTYQAIFTQDLKDEERLRQRLTESLIMYEIYQRNLNQTPHAAKKSADRAVFVAKLHNEKIKKLASLEGETFVDLTKFRGENDCERLVDGFSKGVDRAFARMRKQAPPITKELKEKIQHIAMIATDDNAFQQGWVDLVHMVESDPDQTFAPSLKYICETLTAIRLAAQGKKILIPTDANNGTVDIVGVSDIPVKDLGDLESVANNIDNVIVSLDLTSVKKGGGSKASVPSRLGYTMFDESKVTSADVEKYSDTWVTSLRDGKAPPEVVKEVSKGVFGVLKDRRYRNDIRKYFRVDPKTSDKDLFELIARGTAPPLSTDGMPHPPKYKPVMEALIQVGTPKAKEALLRMQMISALGFISEFMLNRYTKMQLFNNEQYKDTAITRSNAIDAWAFARYEFGEVDINKKTGEPVYKGNIKTLLQNVPREDLETRWGNSKHVERRVARARAKAQQQARTAQRTVYGEV